MWIVLGLDTFVHKRCTWFVHWYHFRVLGPYCYYFTVMGSKTPLGPKRALGQEDHLRVLSVPQNMCQTQMEARSGSPGICHHTSIYICGCRYTKRRWSRGQFHENISSTSNSKLFPLASCDSPSSPPPSCDLPPPTSRHWPACALSAPGSRRTGTPRNPHTPPLKSPPVHLFAYVASRLNKAAAAGLAHLDCLINSPNMCCFVREIYLHFQLKLPSLLLLPFSLSPTCTKDRGAAQTSTFEILACLLQGKLIQWEIQYL